MHDKVDRKTSSTHKELADSASKDTNIMETSKSCTTNSVDKGPAKIRGVWFGGVLQIFLGIV